MTETIVVMARLLVFTLVISGIVDFAHAAIINQLLANHSMCRGEAIMQQFLKYESLSIFNCSEYYETASYCETKVQKDANWVEVGVCGKALTEHMVANRSTSVAPLWPRPALEAYTKPVCQYSVEQVEDSVRHKETEIARRYATLQLRIIQSNCSVEHPKSKGGSSFEVVSTGLTLDYCDVVDNFDDTYNVECRLHPLHRAHSGATAATSAGRTIRYLREESSQQEGASDYIQRELQEGSSHSHLQLCTNISIHVDYEHFDAFAEPAALFDRQYKPLRHPIAVDQIFCYKGNWHHAHPPAATTAASSSDSAPKQLPSAPPINLVTKASAGLWRLVPPLSPPADGIAAAAATATTTATAPSKPKTLTEKMIEKAKQYEWQWLYEVPSMMNSSSKSSCLEGKSVWLVGESHMRYNWDYLTFWNFEGARGQVARLSRHHNDAGYQSFLHKSVYYARMSTIAIDDICDKALSHKSQTIVVIHPGSWDATFWPPQMFIRNPKSGQSVIEGTSAVCLPIRIIIIIIVQCADSVALHNLLWSWSRCSFIIDV